MKTRKLHRYLGVIMLLPMICWAITGVIFFIKPGYKEAYELLQVKAYPIEQSFTIPENSNWQQIRFIRTILGHHLLVKQNGKPLHLNAQTFATWEEPSEANLIMLISDAMTQNPERYGVIDGFDNFTATTNTQVDITIDWDTLQLRQKGTDTDLINLIYKVHYLQWTPWDSVNQVLGVIGLFFLVTLSILGIRLFLRSRR